MDERRRDIGDDGRGLGDNIHHNKRRREDLLGDPVVISKILLNKTEFSRIIGKGGQMINSIKQSSGAGLRGLELNQEQRQLTISGDFRQVISAFEIVSEILCSSNSAMGISGTPFVMRIMIDPSKAGIVVGQKGVNINGLKLKSSAFIKLDKDPVELLPGQPFRIMSIEGVLASIRRAHFHFLELFHDPVMTNSIPSNSFLNSASAGRGHGPSSSHPVDSINLGTLVSRGVHSDVVRQIGEIDTYLNQV